VQGASGSPVQTETVEWVAGSDGAWHVIGDGKSLNPGRSSRTTALATRDRGGFITASLLYQTSTGPYKSGSDPAVQILTSGDGISWNNVTTSVPDVDKSSQMMGVAEFGGQDVFFGADQSQGDAAWVVAASTLP
jgi:hypothetical protein